MTDRYLENSALSYRDAAKRSSAMLPTKGSPWLSAMLRRLWITVRQLPGVPLP